MKDVIMPELEDGNDFAVIAYWHFEEGDPVEEGDDLVAINTSSGTIHLPAPVSGVLHEVYYDEGEDVEANESLGSIEEDEIDDSEISEDDLPDVEYDDNAEDFITDEDLEDEDIEDENIEDEEDEDIEEDDDDEDDEDEDESDED